MDRETLNRNMISTVVDKYLDEMLTNPGRALRNLVDIGSEFTKDPLQKNTITMLQDMLQHEDSQYYNFIHNAAENTDRESLKTFGITLGYGTWNCEAKKLKKKEALCHYGIPWMIFFRRSAQEAQLSAAEIEQIVKEAYETGLRAFVFQTDYSETDQAFLPELINRFPDCDFVLFLEPSAVDSDMLKTFTGCRNLMLFINTGSEGWEDAFSLLRGKRILCGLDCFYHTEEDAETIISGKWMESVNQANSPFAICIAEKGIQKETAQMVHDYVVSSRKGQIFPCMLLDFYADCEFMDHEISSQRTFMGIAPDGKITGSTGYSEIETKDSIAGLPFEIALKKRA